MDIYFMTIVVSQDEVRWTRIISLCISEFLGLQQLTKSWHILLLNNDVQVCVRAGLLTKESVNAPSTIDPDLNAQIT